jgi:hypothetical protein
VASTFSLHLTTQQREEFDRTGVLRLPGYFPAQDMAAMADAVWADMHRRFGIDRRRRETWTVERPGKFQSIVRSGAFRALASQRLFAIGDAFLGAGQWTRPKWVGAPMVTFSKGETWDVPHRLWHLDTSASDCLDRLPLIRFFTFLEASRPRGGGTPYILGSHCLAVEIAARTPQLHLHSPDIRAVLEREHPWFAELFKPAGDDRRRRFMVEGAVIDGLEVRVCEMTGEPGDVVVMHPAMFHSIAVNALDRPRMMLMQFLWRHGQTEPEM